MIRTSFVTNQSALVTGATQGIGLALSHNLLSHGWTVFGTGRDVESLARTKRLFKILYQLRRI